MKIKIEIEVDDKDADKILDKAKELWDKITHEKIPDTYPTVPFIWPDTCPPNPYVQPFIWYDTTKEVWTSTVNILPRKILKGDE